METNVKNINELATTNDAVGEEIDLENYPDMKGRSGVFIDLEGQVVYEIKPDTTHSLVINSLTDDGSLGELAFGYLYGDIALIDDMSNMSVTRCCEDIKKSDMPFNKIYSLSGGPGEDSKVTRLAKRVYRR